MLQQLLHGQGQAGRVLEACGGRNHDTAADVQHIKKYFSTQCLRENSLIVITTTTRQHRRRRGFKSSVLCFECNYHMPNSLSRSKRCHLKDDFFTVSSFLCGRQHLIKFHNFERKIILRSNSDTFYENFKKYAVSFQWKIRFSKKTLKILIGGDGSPTLSNSRSKLKRNR